MYSSHFSGVQQNLWSKLYLFCMLLYFVKGNVQNAILSVTLSPSTCELISRITLTPLYFYAVV